MSIITNAYQLVINGSLPGGQESLMKSITDGNPISEKPIWMQGDKCAVRLYFRTPGEPGEPSTAAELPAVFSMVMAGALSDSTDPLFQVSEWLKTGESDYYYAGTIDLNTPAITAAFLESNNAAGLDVQVDIEVRDVSNTSRITFRGNITLARQKYADLALPPSTLSASYLQSPDGSTWQVSIDDNGQESWSKIGIPQQDPAFITIQAANFVTPSGYVYDLSIDDDGQKSIRRIQ